MDYCITWSYIVSRMQSKFGFSPDNEEKLSFGEIEKYIYDIWVEFFEILYKKEMEQKRKLEVKYE